MLCAPSSRTITTFEACESWELCTMECSAQINTDQRNPLKKNSGRILQMRNCCRLVDPKARKDRVSESGH